MVTSLGTIKSNVYAKKVQTESLMTLTGIAVQCAAKKDPLNKYHYFGIVQYFCIKFSEIILDTICHYCCRFYHLNFRCLHVEVAQFLI